MIKDKTKLRIIKWVEKVLNYQHPPTPLFIETKRKIKLVQSSARMTEGNFVFDHKAITKRLLEINLLDELVDSGLIQYGECKNDFEHTLTAKVFVVEPFKEHHNE